jgi:pimeloyl-ACP methyl ester carboxylesterase
MTTFFTDEVAPLSVDGPSATFRYRRVGPRGGVPLVLFNRFRGTIDWWDPEFLGYLAADHDVIVFDNVGIGYTTGEPSDSIDGFADGAIEFIEALGLFEVDVLGWSLGGVVAQEVARRRPELVRRVVVAGSGPGGVVPGTPPMSDRVLTIMAKPEADEEDMLYLWYPETDAARSAGHTHLDNVSEQVAHGPALSDAAAEAQLTAIGQLLAVPFDEVQTKLEGIKQPVLYANGMQDVMVSALASYAAVQHLTDGTLLLYGDAGHAFLFQHAKAFTTAVADFLAD